MDTYAGCRGRGVQRGWGVRFGEVAQRTISGGKPGAAVVYHKPNGMEGRTDKYTKETKLTPQKMSLRGRGVTPVILALRKLN